MRTEAELCGQTCCEYLRFSGKCLRRNVGGATSKEGSLRSELKLGQSSHPYYVYICQGSCLRRSGEIFNLLVQMHACIWSKAYPSFRTYSFRHCIRVEISTESVSTNKGHHLARRGQTWGNCGNSLEKSSKPPFLPPPPSFGCLETQIL